MSILEYDRAVSIIQHLDSISDIVIVSFHGGAEGQDHQHVPRRDEFFIGENRGNVYEFSHRLIDAGADVIFGHGPHVTRGIEVYKNRFIAYSLGNFCTYKGINVLGVNGLAPIIKVYTNRTGSFLQAQITAIQQFYGVGIKIDPKKQVIKKIQQLSKEDFPESKIQIDDSGLVTMMADH